MNLTYTPRSGSSCMCYNEVFALISHFKIASILMEILSALNGGPISHVLSVSSWFALSQLEFSSGYSVQHSIDASSLHRYQTSIAQLYAQSHL